MFRIYYMFDPSTFGLALMWSGPLKDGTTGHLSCHRIHAVIAGFVVAVEWGGIPDE